MTSNRDESDVGSDDGDGVILKRSKLDEEWFPSSVKEIENVLQFDSSTFHSRTPEAIASDPTVPIVLGVDEAGRGPVLGPMVYGIAYAKESFQQELKKYGFADSKSLKEDVRQRLFKQIESPNNELFANLGWAVTTMTAKDISSGMLQSPSGKGSYNLNEQAHDTTIELIRQVLARNINVTKVFVDTVGPPASYQAKLLKIFPTISITVTKKADSIYPIVSAASIVAKVTRDQNLKYLITQIPNMKGQFFGSGYPSDPNTSKWLAASVDRVFGWHFGLVRFSWQTAKDCLEKNGAQSVIYESQCVLPDAGYKDITSYSFTAEPSSDSPQRDLCIDKLFYGSSSVSL